MKSTWIFLLTTVFAPLSFATDSYSGKSILDYLAAGTYYGERCQVEVRYSDTFKSVSVVVTAAPDKFRPFNNLLGTKEAIFEDRQASTYDASFVLVPNDEYTGRRRYTIKIEGKNKGRIRVTTSEARRFLGIWGRAEELSCLLF